jgi:hypothetical protein
MFCALDCGFFYEVNEYELFVGVIGTCLYQRHVKVVQLLYVLVVVGKLLGTHHLVNELEVLESV